MSLNGCHSLTEGGGSGGHSYKPRVGRNRTTSSSYPTFPGTSSRVPRTFGTGRDTVPGLPRVHGRTLDVSGPDRLKLSPSISRNPLKTFSLCNTREIFGSNRGLVYSNVCAHVCTGMCVCVCVHTCTRVCKWMYTRVRVDK